MTWREQIRPIVANVIEENEGQPEKVIRKALTDAYPYGLRQNYPYQVWLDEIRKQLDAIFRPEEPKKAGPIEELPLFGGQNRNANSGDA